MIGCPGRFHEISITTPDLAASVEFYRRLGFSVGTVLPVWPHPYAVVGDGAVVLGLHQYKFPSPSITCVADHLDAARRSLREAGVTLAFDIDDPQRFNEFGYRDPGGTMLTMLERPTHRGIAPQTSQCGSFVGFDLPSHDFVASENFWGAARVAGGLPVLWHDATIDAGCQLVFDGRSPASYTAPEGTRLVVRT